MQLIEIDVVGAESCEAVVARAAHVFGTRTLALLVDRLLPSSLERTAEKLFAPGRAVDVGGVEEVDARVERRAHHTLRGGFVDAHAEVVATEADRGDTKRPERTEVHQESIQASGLRARTREAKPSASHREAKPSARTVSRRRALAPRAEGERPHSG